MPLPMFKSEEASPSSKIKSIVAIAAGKGGVGKSTLTVNLGLALRAMGYSVGIMDTDIYGPSLRKMLPEDRMPVQRGEKIIPALCSGMEMISMAYFRREDEASAVRAPIANNIVGQFIQNVVWGDLDYLLIDFPPGTGDIQLTLSQQLNLTGAVMITTPQEVSVMDVKKAMHLFEQVRVPIVGVVENMSYYFHEGTQEKIHLFGKGGGEKLARESGTPFLGELALDPYLSQCGDTGTSLFVDNEKGQKSKDAFIKLAAKVKEHIDLISVERDRSIQDFELVWKEMVTS